MSVLQVEKLSKTFGTGDLAVQALREASFSVERGELVALLGPSGSGKSTLLLCLSLIEEPSGGTIRVAGRDAWRAHRHGRPRERLAVHVEQSAGDGADRAETLMRLAFFAVKDGHNALIDVNTFDFPRRAQAALPDVTALLPATLGSELDRAVGRSQAGLEVFDLGTGERVASIPIDPADAPITHLAFAPDAQRLATSDGPLIQIHDLATAKTTRWDAGTVLGLAWRQDGAVLFSGAERA